ncbi:MAG: hypothetical protein LBQ12_14805 [Deltaproteobacteria bacterium]|nr:hypothetical protein [Deltaproteobacteria bacterium]
MSLLERFAKAKGLKVSTGKLFYAGLRLKSGQCVYREEPWLVLDRFQAFDDQLELFRKAFADLKIGGLTEEVESLLYPGGSGLLERARDGGAAILPESVAVGGDEARSAVGVGPEDSSEAVPGSVASLGPSQALRQGSR